MPVTCKEIQYPNYGRCLEMANGLCRLAITLDAGPRIICYQLHGRPNMMYEDLENTTLMDGPAMDSYYYPGAVWHIYGGHRLWLSPELVPATYYPDNDPVAYEVEGNTATFAPPEQKGNQLQFIYQITLAEDSTDVTIAHTIRSCGGEVKRIAPWGLTVLAKGGVEIVPQADKDTGLLGNRNMSLWPYSDMADDRVYWGTRYITLQQDPGKAEKFKVGINHEKQWSAYLRDGDLFIKRFETVENGDYPDNGCSFETFTCAHFLEMESLGQLVSLAPGDELEHTEHWSLKAVADTFDRKNEESIRRFAETHVDSQNNK